MTKFFVAMVAASCLFAGAGPAVGADPEDGQYYRIKNARTEKVLSVSEKGKEEGATIEEVARSPSLLQQWTFVKVGDYYKIVNRKTGMALNDPERIAGGRRPIIQWDASVDNENQQWSLM